MTSDEALDKMVDIIYEQQLMLIRMAESTHENGGNENDD